MKKRAQIILIVGIFCLTGCGRKTLNCSMQNDANEEIKITQNIITTYQKDVMKQMDMRIVMDFSDHYAEYTDELEKNLKETYKNYEDKAGIEINTDSKDKKVTLTFTADFNKMDKETKKDFDIVGTSQTMKEVRSDLEEQGYTCKEA